MKVLVYTETAMKSRPWVAFPPRNLKKPQDFSISYTIFEFSPRNATKSLRT